MLQKDRFFPRDEYYMRLALREAERALEHDDVPIGAVIVREGEVLAAACNEILTYLRNRGNVGASVCLQLLFDQNKFRLH